MRGKKFKTTVPGDFTASRPNELWVADLTKVATQRGFVFVAFVIDMFARMIRPIL